MPRIYYRERKLHNEPLENNVITTDIFNEIIRMASFIPEGELQIFELPQKSSSFFFWKNDKAFKYAVVWNAEMPHTTYEYGDFFLPKALVFYDVKDAYFPSEYFSIVNIDDALEVGVSRAGINTAWYEQPLLWHKVTQPKCMRRLEKSVKELHNILSKTND